MSNNFASSCEKREKSIGETRNRFTVPSDRFSGFDGIRGSFIQTKNPGSFSFFFKSPAVVTERDMAARRRKMDYRSVMIVCMSLKACASRKSQKEMHGVDEGAVRVAEAKYSQFPKRARLVCYLINVKRSRATILLFAL